MKFVILAIGSLLSLGFLVIGWLYLNQEKLLFFPETLPEDFKFKFSLPFVESTIQLSSGARINTLSFVPQNSKGVILYFHGNAGSLKDWGHTAAQMTERTGWNVWIVDYPGFGKSSGNLPKTEQPLIETARLLRNQISEIHPNLPVVLFGRSLGSGIATALAHEVHPAALILETPYLSIAKLGHEIYPILPESFSRFHLDNERWLPTLGSTPILILHGTGDKVIPYRHGEILDQIANRLGSYCRLVLFQDGEHNNLVEFPEYWPSVVGFLTDALKPKNI